MNAPLMNVALPGLAGCGFCPQAIWLWYSPALAMAAAYATNIRKRVTQRFIFNGLLKVDGWINTCDARHHRFEIAHAPASTRRDGRKSRSHGPARYELMMQPHWLCETEQSQAGRPKSTVVVPLLTTGGGGGLVCPKIVTDWKRVAPVIVSA
jgi:hypothetical protein